MISETVRVAFPTSTSKQHGKSRSTFVHGIEENVAASSQDTMPCTSDHSVNVLKETLEVEKKRNGELLMYTEQLEKPSSYVPRGDRKLVSRARRSEGGEGTSGDCSRLSVCNRGML